MTRETVPAVHIKATFLLVQGVLVHRCFETAMWAQEFVSTVRTSPRFGFFEAFGAFDAWTEDLDLAGCLMAAATE
jgi:hypothetical protein